MKFIYLTFCLMGLTSLAIGQDSSVVSLSEGSFSFDVFPSFKDCQGSSRTRQKCTEEKMFSFIQEKLEYPAKAKLNKIEGSILVSFIIDTNGKINEITPLNDIGGNCEEEAKRLIEELEWANLVWQPATRKGKPITTKVYYPIFFDLKKSERPTPSFEVEFIDKDDPNNDQNDEINFSSNDNKVYTIVDKMPLFPFFECEGLTERGNTNAFEANRCANDAFQNYLKRNIKYPETAYQQGISGEVVITFIIEKDGSITSPKILSDVKGGCGQAVLTFIKEMQNSMRWIAGEKNGKTVKTKYFVSYKFDLEEEKKKRGK